MSLFPHFAPVQLLTPDQVNAILGTVHAQPRVVRFDQITSTLAIVATVYTLLLIWLINAMGISVKMRDVAERVAPKALFLQGVLTYLMMMVFLSLAGLPLSSYRGYFIPRDYGLMNETYLAWLGDHFKAIGIDTLVWGMIAGMLLVLIQRQPLRWPYIFAGILTPIIAFGIFLEPLVVDPLFNKFTPLSQSQPIYSEIKSVAIRAGIQNVQIFVVDKSKQTNETNAYVTGFGPSARIVIWDTLLNKMTDREVISIVGHEMGHYVEGHLLIGFVLSAAGLFMLFPIMRWMVEQWHVHHKFARKVRSLSDPAAIPLLLLCFQLLMLLVQPVSNQVSRWIEYRADAFSLGVVRDRIGLATSFVDLGKQNLEDPDAPFWEKFWFDDHPPLRERVEFALSGQPE